MKLSIIIPAYNVASYIEKCIESIIHQNLDEYEMQVIIINDGSTDNTLEIIQNLLEKYPQLIFVNQDNKGVSEARNTGLKIAKGEYVLFIDPDDFIVSNSLLKIIRQSEKLNLDLMYLDMVQINEQYERTYHYPKVGEVGIVKKGLNHPRRTFPATLYKRNIIGNIKFIKNIIRGQDSVFNAMVHSLSKRVSYCSEPYYFYLERETSSRSNVTSFKAYQGFLSAIDVLDKFKQQHFSAENKDAQQYFDKVILVFLTRIVELHILPNLYQQKYRETKKLLSDLGYWHLSKSIAEKYPYFDSSFAKFALHQKKLIFKTKVYQLLQKIKKL